MPLLGGGELAHRMVDRLYVAKTSNEAHLRKVARRPIVEADIERSAFAEQAEEPILKRWPKKSPSRWPNNAAGRRQEAQRAARAPNASEEATRARMYVRRPPWKWQQALRKRI